MFTRPRSTALGAMVTKSSSLLSCMTLALVLIFTKLPILVSEDMLTPACITVPFPIVADLDKVALGLTIEANS